jgi:starch synthase
VSVSLTGRPPRLGVMMVASEAAPWAKTGGLADVIAALPDALVRLGHRVTSVLPRYRGVVMPHVESHRHAVRLGPAVHEIVLHVASLGPRQRVVFVDSPRHFDRDTLYGPGGTDYSDNAERFGLLSAAALDLADAQAAEHPVDIVHAHDWQTGLVPTFARVHGDRWRSLAGAGFVFTIHNLAYQGVFPRETVPALGLPWSVFRIESAEFWGQFSCLKAGIHYSDWVTTVSPTYARETQGKALGAGMDGVLRARADRYVGILNGIDTDVWNPKTDAALPAPFDAADLAGKRRCKLALLERFRLPLGDDAMERPIVGLISRLVEQKGLDLVAAASEELAALDATFVFAGTGEARYEHFLRAFAARHPARVGVFIGFDERLAHLVEAGSDMFLMPSRFEPCGLNQMYSLRYGTVPIVHGVGGLEDTIRRYTPRARRPNGFKFAEATAESLLKAVRQAIRLYREPQDWLRLMRQGMSEEHSWDTSAREYVKVYRRARRDAGVRART